MGVYGGLAQRINTWLTSRTTSGVLFETDLELRPSGASGLLVSSVGAFEQYQERSAWVWEHQALTRARYSAGEAAIGGALRHHRPPLPTPPRPPKEVATEVPASRGNIP